MYLEHLAAILCRLQGVTNTTVAAATGLLEALATVLTAAAGWLPTEMGLEAAEAAVLVMAQLVDRPVPGLRFAATPAPAALLKMLLAPAYTRLRAAVLLVLRPLVLGEEAVAELVVAGEVLPVLLQWMPVASPNEAGLIADLLLTLLAASPARPTELLPAADEVATALMVGLQQCFLRHFNSSPALRNDVIVIFLQLEEHYGQLFTPDMVSEWLLVLCAPDLRPSSLNSRGLQLGCSHVDFELHKVLVLLAQRLCRHEHLRPSLRTGHLLKLLLLYLGPSVRGWTPPQQEELHLQALAVLAHVGPLFVSDMLALRAPAQLLELLASSLAGGRGSLGTTTAALGNSFYGSDNSFATSGLAQRAANAHRPSLNLCLGAIVALLQATNTALAEDFADQVRQATIYLSPRSLSLVFIFLPVCRECGG